MKTCDGKELKGNVAKGEVMKCNKDGESGGDEAVLNSEILKQVVQCCYLGKDIVSTSLTMKAKVKSLG